MASRRAIGRIASGVLATAAIFVVSSHGEAFGPANCGDVYEWKHYTAHDPFQTWEMDHSGSSAKPSSGTYDYTYHSLTPNQYGYHVELRHEAGYDHIVDGEQVHQGCS